MLIFNYFNFSYKRRDTGVTIDSIAGITDLYRDIPGLTVGTEYIFELMCTNEKGDSNPVSITYTVTSPSTHGK